MTYSFAKCSPWLLAAIAAYGSALTLPACSGEIRELGSCESLSNCAGSGGSSGRVGNGGTASAGASGKVGNGGTPDAGGAGKVFNGGSPADAGVGGRPEGEGEGGAFAGEAGEAEGGHAGAMNVGGASGGTLGVAGHDTGGGGTVAGAGQGGASAGFACPRNVPSGPLITEFADLVPASSNAFTFTLGVLGGTFVFPPDLTSTSTGMALNIKGNVNSDAGFGLYFNSCQDASAYSGISFDIKGSVGTRGKLNFRVRTNGNTPPEPATMVGSCPVPSGTTDTYSFCHLSAVDITVAEAGTPVEVRFNQLEGGAPTATVTGKDIIGLEWGFDWNSSLPAYVVDVTLDNIKFISGTGGGGP